MSKELRGEGCSPGHPCSKLCLLSSDVNKDWKEGKWEGSFQREAKQVLLEGGR